MKTSRRRKKVVDRKVQFRLLVYNWIYFLIITISIALVLFLPLSMRLYTSGLSWVQQGNLSRNVLFLHGNLWPVILVVFILLSLHSLLISNKLVGPLHRFQSALQDFVNGTPWTTPYLRQDDLLFDDLLKLGTLLDSVQNRMDRIRAEHDEMDRLIENMSVDLNEERYAGEMQVKLLRISQQYARLKRAIEGSVLPDANLGDASSEQEKTV